MLLGILLLFSWVSLVGLVRAEFLRGRNFEYIQAARALGVSNAVIIFRHLLAERHGGDHDVPAVHFVVIGDDAHGARLPRLWPAAGFAVARRVAQPGQGERAAPWLGLTGFFSIAIMLSLLIFIGEAVRDAFDPRKTFR